MNKNNSTSSNNNKNNKKEHYHHPLQQQQHKQQHKQHVKFRQILYMPADGAQIAIDWAFPAPSLSSWDKQQQAIICLCENIDWWDIELVQSMIVVCGRNV